MKNSKKAVVVIMIICILLLSAVAAFAYVYLETDILKSDKELFFKYFAQITSDDGFIDGKMKKYYENKKQLPYENSGEISVDVQYPEELLKTVIDKVNDLTIKFEGKVDSMNQKVEQNIEVDYGNNVVFPVNYRKDGDKFGIQLEKLSKQFIATRNDHLNDFVKKITGQDIIETQNKTLEMNELVEKLKFTEEEQKQLKQIYGQILEQELPQEQFWSFKSEQGEGYVLELSCEQIKNIMIKMLETTKQNTFLIDKINNIMSQYVEECEKIEVTQIDDLIDEINEKDVTTLPKLKLTLVQVEKKLNQIIIQFGENQIEIQKNIVGNKLRYDFECVVKETTEESKESMEDTSETEEYKVYFNAEYTGLDSLSNIQENYELGFNISTEGQTMAYDYKINCNTEFAESVLIQSLDDDVAVFLNNHNEEQVTNFLQQVLTKILEINKKQMAELGLKEYENPLLYSNPIITMGILIFNNASDVIVNADMSKQEIQAFNNKFAVYVGDERRGSEVNEMINTVLINNLNYEGNVDKTVKVTVDEIEISGAYRVDMSALYIVEAVYNDDGYITEMLITTKN